MRYFGRSEKTYRMAIPRRPATKLIPMSCGRLHCIMSQGTFHPREFAPAFC